jgi:hypothetical protein
MFIRKYLVQKCMPEPFQLPINFELTLSNLKCFAALPLDVRKGFAFPLGSQFFIEAVPRFYCRKQRHSLKFLKKYRSESRRLSAHRRAKPEIYFLRMVSLEIKLKQHLRVYSLSYISISGSSQSSANEESAARCSATSSSVIWKFEKPFFDFFSVRKSTKSSTSSTMSGGRFCIFSIKAEFCILTIAFRQKFVIAHLAVISVERTDRFAGRVEHLFGHRNRIA